MFFLFILFIFTFFLIIWILFTTHNFEVVCFLLLVGLVFSNEYQYFTLRKVADELFLSNFKDQVDESVGFVFHMLWYLVTNYTSSHIYLPYYLSIYGASKDWLLRMMLGNITSNFTIFSQTNEHIHIFSFFKSNCATSSTENINILYI